MKLFVLNRIGVVDYDEYDSLVVRAKDVKHARAWAKYHTHEDIWTNREESTCESLKHGGIAGVIVSSFNAG